MRRPIITKVPTRAPSLYPEYLAMAASEHDPLQRQLESEPRFVLLGRDPLAEGLTRLWAALFSQNTSAADDIYRNLKVIAGKLPFQPHKQSSHALSAKAVANNMGIWRMAREAEARQPVRTEPVKS